MEKFFLEKYFGVCYSFGGLRKQAEKLEGLRKHGHSILKASPNETESQQRKSIG
ncbi:MAG: hypothetical protein IJG32_06270 [Selenomonadaceae bacterium]|nr:hypothetical protein [Selenomonadaceae bacterium]MBQ7493488.1 hypothetical protein [Selenomonadaceae bacterium]